MTARLTTPNLPNTPRWLSFAALHAGQRPDRAALLREHPELAAPLKCIEALDGLVPPADSDFAPATQLFEDGPLSDADARNGTEAVPYSLPRDFGPYELLAEVGRGGMGVVYKARQKALDRIVAVKMILSTHLASPEHIRRFQVEAWAAARVRHSNITQIHDVGQHHGQHYFAMEHIEGESLAQRIARPGARDSPSRRPPG